MKYLGGMNKGRPNAEDLDRARAFAQELKQRFPVSGEVVRAALEDQEAP
jgi:hypothetical protein